MPKRKMCLFLLLALVALCSEAQEQRPAPEKKQHATTAVVYDPIFWAAQLRLTRFQQARIREINSRFYETIQSESKAPSREHSARLAYFLQQRSDEIIGTFQPKQHRKWENIVETICQ